MSVIPRSQNAALAKIPYNVDAAANACGVTAPIIFQAAYSLLLAKLTATTDVTYDNLLTGRNVPLDNPQRINGNCANFLPFRAHVSSRMSLVDFLRSTQDLLWQNTKTGSVSSGDNYEDARVEKQARTMFCFQPFDPPTKDQEQMRGIVMSLSRVEMTFNYALMVEVFKDTVEHKVKMQYDGRAFGKQEAEAVLSDYTELVKVIVDMARRALWEIWLKT